MCQRIHKQPIVVPPRRNEVGVVAVRGKICGPDPVTDPAPTRPVQQCLSCGAVVQSPETELSTTCAYCTSQLVDAERGAAAVDRVAPFRVPRAAALDRLRQYLAGRLWAPGDLRTLASRGSVRATMRGVLVPFYVYDAECRSRYHARVGVHWYRTETKKDKEGKKQSRRVRETEWFPLDGTAADRLAGHQESASRGLTATDLRGLRHFDLGRAVRFDPHLLAGWHAELPSRQRDDVDREARARITSRETKRIRNQVLPGDTHKRVHIDCSVKVLGVQSVLLPVWITTYRYQGRVFRMLVHGQTGRCFGEVPVSRAKVVTASLVVAVIGLIAALVIWPRLRTITADQSTAVEATSQEASK